MSKKTYSEKLVNPKWQKKRLEILQLKDFTCELCGNDENELHVHHRFYIKGREPWEYDNDVFMVLCHKCHENEHKNKQVSNKYHELISVIESFEDFDLDHLLSFLQSMDIEKANENMIILSNAFNSDDFEFILNILKDKVRIESLEIQLFMLKDEFNKKIA